MEGGNTDNWQYWVLFFGELYVIFVVSVILVFHLRSKITIVIDHNTEALKDLKDAMNKQADELKDSALQVKYNTKMLEKLNIPMRTPPQ